MKKLIAVLAMSFLCHYFPSRMRARVNKNKMKTCNEEANAKALKGDERKDFMKSCLSARAPAKDGSSQQEKMKTCLSA